MKNSIRKIIKPILLILLGFGAGYVVANQKFSVQYGGVNIILASNTDYKFINPLVGVDFALNQNFPELTTFENKISQYIEGQRNANNVDKVSVYFRTLLNAHRFSINGNEKFNPGSLLKVPIMMAFYKEAEVDPSVLNKKVKYVNGSESKSLPNELPTKLKNNGAYSIGDLISYMIIDSDNGAKDLLLDNLDSRYLEEIYADLNISSTDDNVSADVYARFFRRLYGATFLDREYSEEALKLLSQTTFVNGLAAGVPANTKVAHKYGERGIYDAKNNLTGFELHDCGIIYYPAKPVLLCVMTQGKDINVLANVIKNIADIVSSNQ